MKVLPRRRRAVLMNSVLGVVLLAAAAGAYAAVNSDSTTPARTGTRTATVAKGTVLATVSGSGSLVSPSDAGVSFTTGGTLTEVKVAPGDKVTKGEVLAKVDPAAADETLQEDQATLTADEANLTKAEAGQTTTTSAGGGSSRGGSAAQTTTTTVDPASVAQAQAQVTQAQNAVDAAQAAVTGTELVAPVSGTVASVGGKVGQTVSGSSGNSGGSGGGSGSGSSGSSAASSASSSSSSEPSGFVVITNPTGMQVTADFSEADSLKIKAGQPATVTLNAESGTVLNAKVLSISSLPVSSGSGSGGGNGGGSAVQYAATLAISGSTANLRTGLSATIQVVTGEASDALYVPAEAVSGTGAARTVTVVAKDGTTKTVNVTVGVQGDTDDQITSGLTQGETVQIASVASTGTNGFPSGAFPGGAGGGRGFGGGGRGGFGGGGRG